MGSSFLFYEDYLFQVSKVCSTPLFLVSDSLSASHSSDTEPCHHRSSTGSNGSHHMGGGTDIWHDKPTTKGFILYSIITTIICSFGILGNSLSLMVLKRKELTGSIYTYLAVLAATDLALSILFFFSGLIRGVFYDSRLATYEALIGMPVSAAINSLGVMATVAVTIDRVLFLRHPVQFTRPRFCNPRVARKLMTIGVFLTVLMNVPYCFILKWDHTGNLKTSPFFYTKFYTCFNWFMLIVLTFIPCLVLTIGNGFLITALRKSHKITARCNGKRRDHTNLTITLIAIIIMFLISEVPSNMVSRMKANSLLYGGHPERHNYRKLEIPRQICAFLGAVNVTVNFLLYYLFCPAFCRALVNTFKRENKRRAQPKSKVNVFVVNNHEVCVPEVKSTILEVARLSTKSHNCLRKELSENKNLQKAGNSNDTEYVEIIDSMDVCRVGEYSSLDEGSFTSESTATAKNY